MNLRHTFATRLVIRAPDIVTVQNLLRHSTIAMTLRYSHAGAPWSAVGPFLCSGMDTTPDKLVEFAPSKFLQGN
jgi:hypothetical protein